MKLYCCHEGLCLFLSLQEQPITMNEFCRRMGISLDGLQELTRSKRLDDQTKELAAAALELPLSEIFNNRVQKIWSFHLPFSRFELQSFTSNYN